MCNTLSIFYQQQFFFSRQEIKLSFHSMNDCTEMKKYIKCAIKFKRLYKRNWSKKYGIIIASFPFLIRQERDNACVLVWVKMGCNTTETMYSLYSLYSFLHYSQLRFFSNISFSNDIFLCHCDKCNVHHTGCDRSCLKMLQPNSCTVQPIRHNLICIRRKSKMNFVPKRK